MPPEAALRPSPPISDLLKGHSYFFAASKEAKQSFDFDALVVSIRRHGGKVETRPSAGLARYLITDITDEDRLAKLIGNQVLASVNVRGLDYVDGVIAIWEQSNARRKGMSDAQTRPTQGHAPEDTPAQASRTSLRKRSRSSSPTDVHDSSRQPPVSRDATGTTTPSHSIAPAVASTSAIPLHSPATVKTFVDHVPHTSSRSARTLAAALELPLDPSVTTARVRIPPHPSLKGEALHYFNPDLPAAGFKAGVVLDAPSAERNARGVVADPVGRWGFPREMVARFPALNKRNFFVIQWHQATALHYDLRLQCSFSAANFSDGNFIRLPTGAAESPGTISFAVPKGVHGMPLGSGEGNGRYAAQTNLHPISYTTYEGGDGRKLSSGDMCGTLLWDVGTYTVVEKNADPDSDNDQDEADDHQEKVLLEGMLRRSFEITLHGQFKVKRLTLQFSRTHVKHDGRQQAKPQWFFRRTDRGGKAVEVDCEDGGRSCLTGRTLKEVTEGPTVKWAPWLSELGMVMDEE